MSLVETVSLFIQSGGPLCAYRDALDRGTHVSIDGQRLLAVSTTNYHDLSHHPEVINASIRATMTHGAGSEGVPMLSGQTTAHKRLANRLSYFYNTDETYLFNSCYMANISVFSALVATLNAESCYIIYDQYCHASMMDGMRLAVNNRVKLVSFPNGDVEALEKTLKSLPTSAAKILAFEGVYSMDGTVAPLPQLLALARDYGCITLCDESHALGTIGARGHGIMEYWLGRGTNQYDLENDCPIDIITGTLSKTLGAVGGYVTGRLSYMKGMMGGRGQVFSVGLSSGDAAAALQALQLLEEGRSGYNQLQANSKLWREGLKRLGLSVGGHDDGVITTIMFPNQMDKMLAFCLALKERGIFATPICYPAVPKELTRIRTAMKASHTFSMVEDALQKIKEAIQVVRMQPKAKL